MAFSSLNGLSWPFDSRGSNYLARSAFRKDTSNIVKQRQMIVPRIFLTAGRASFQIDVFILSSSLHKTLMKLQIDQIESFDRWLSETEARLEKDLEIMEETLPGVERQYRQLAQLQDELVAQQQITESLQNMVIVIDDSSSSSDQADGPKYSSSAIESKLLNLSERWAQICNFVQNRWIQLQEVKIELEQFESNREKIEQWLKRKEEEVQKIKSQSPTSSDAQLQTEQAHAIQVCID